MTGAFTDQRPFPPDDVLACAEENSMTDQYADKLAEQEAETVAEAHALETQAEAERLGVADAMQKLADITAANEMPKPETVKAFTDAYARQETEDADPDNAAVEGDKAP